MSPVPTDAARPLSQREVTPSFLLRIIDVPQVCAHPEERQQPVRVRRGQGAADDRLAAAAAAALHTAASQLLRRLLRLLLARQRLLLLQPHQLRLWRTGRTR